MRDEEPFDRAIEDNDFQIFVAFDCRDDLLQLRNRLRAENVERRMIERDAPVLR